MQTADTKLNILQIANGYCNAKLYSELFQNINNYDIKQTVFIPLRYNQKGIKYKLDSKNIHYISELVIKNTFDRLFFDKKIIKSLKAIESNINLSEINISHAHTLFSDGAIAYFLKKKYNIPYIVAIRNTDINVFLKYLIHKRTIGKEILLNSEKIIFLSQSYKEELVNYFPQIKQQIEEKSEITYNGISNFWLENSFSEPKKKPIVPTFLFVGQFVKNKNLLSILDAFSRVKTKKEVKLICVGYSENEENKYSKAVLKKTKKISDIEILNEVSSVKLLSIFRRADIFIMPSFKESFGLVYAEALSQKLPIIYSERQGFDKVFPESFVGYSVNPKKVTDIEDKMLKIIDNFSQIQMNMNNICSIFDWSIIAKKYFIIYKQISAK